jgi:hypothetical protein
VEPLAPAAAIDAAVGSVRRPDQSRGWNQDPFTVDRHSSASSRWLPLEGATAGASAFLADRRAAHRVLRIITVCQMRTSPQAAVIAAPRTEWST